MNSLRKTLLIALLGATLPALLIGAWATYHEERQQANTIFDYHLRQIALALRDQDFQVPVPPLDARGEQFDFAIQVWSDQGISLYYSRPLHFLPNRAQLGFATVATDEGPWRTYAIQNRAEIIQVAQPMSRRDQLAATAAWRSLWPFLLLIPAMGSLIWMIVGHGLAPISRLARAVAARTPDAEQAISEKVPQVVQPLVKALNGLLARLHDAIQVQRQFVADAAHELRTPLTALGLQVQLVQRAQSEEERSAALAELQLGLSRASRLVQQLLAMARAEPGATQPTSTVIEINRLLGEVIDDYRPIAAAKNIDIALTVPEDVPLFRGDKSALDTLFANLLDNAVHYAPENSSVAVSLSLRGSGVVVAIDDAGPGIPAADRQRVFDRFYRCEGTSESGSGLGLAIVRAIAERHGLKVVLNQSSAGGVCAQVEFPQVTVASAFAAASATRAA